MVTEASPPGTNESQNTDGTKKQKKKKVYRKKEKLKANKQDDDPAKPDTVSKANQNAPTSSNNSARTQRLPLDILDPLTGESVLLKERAKRTSLNRQRRSCEEVRSRFSTMFLTPNGQEILFTYTARNIPATPEKGDIVQL